jgi:hypothetical protein
MVSWLVGPRSMENAIAFMQDIRSRVTKRIQLTTNGHAMYEVAVRAAFKWNEVHWAMLVKQYGSEADPADPTWRYRSAGVHRRTQGEEDRATRSRPSKHQLHRAVEPDPSDAESPVYPAHETRSARRRNTTPTR